MTPFHNFFFSPIMLLDVHTHHLPPLPETALWSCCMQDKDLPAFEQARWISPGIHPWYLSSGTLDRQAEWLGWLLAGDARVLAVGESGLDRLCGTPFDVQQEAFRISVSLSERYRIPLVIHAVKSFNELVACKKETNPSQPWIIHGFRGKKELAASLLRHGFYLSVGDKFNAEAVKIVPSGRLLAETDDKGCNISEVVRKLAEERGETCQALRTVLSLNAAHLFFKR